MGVLGGLRGASFLPCARTWRRLAPAPVARPQKTPRWTIPETSTADARGDSSAGRARRECFRHLCSSDPAHHETPCFSSSSPPLTQQAQVAEVAAVSAHFAAPAGLAATGATVAGIKYMFVRGEENAEIYVKKVSALPRACLHPNPFHPSSAEVVS